VLKFGVKHQLILQKTENEILGVTPGVGIISFQIRHLGGVGVTPGVTLTLRDGNSNTNTKNITLKNPDMKCHSGVGVYEQC
jgi:hypothetical protein